VPLRRKECCRMIEVYSWAAPSGHKLHLMVEATVMQGTEVLAARRKPLLDDKARDVPFGATRCARYWLLEVAGHADHEPGGVDILAQRRIDLIERQCLQLGVDLGGAGHRAAEVEVGGQGERKVRILRA
jgi:hypothetical protein